MTMGIVDAPRLLVEPGLATVVSLCAGALPPTDALCEVHPGRRGFSGAWKGGKQFDVVEPTFRTMIAQAEACSGVHLHPIGDKGCGRGGQPCAAEADDAVVRVDGAFDGFTNMILRALHVFRLQNK